MVRSLLLSCLSLPWVLGLSEPQDLSHSYDNTTLYWAFSTPFSFTKVVTAPLDQWYAANEFQTAEHGGTHLDAPYHFNYNGWQVGDIPLHRLIGRAVLLDLRQKASNDSDYLVSVEDFEDWEEQQGPIPDGAVIIMDFGWASKYKNASEYFGTPFTNNTELYHFPGLSEAGAQWLVDTGKVFGVGTDTASIDYGQSKDFKAHKVLSAHNIYNLVAGGG
uniref:Cyclase n=1 Tax=Cuerna arida TaxID=1464854 RepID=A0A1B6GTM3_9HEMI